jgi:hypothetical protein
MPAANSGVDALGLFLTGGASNGDPDLSLGGARSSAKARGLGVIVSSPIPGIKIENVYPACEEGEGSLSVGSDGASLLFTPPDGLEGEAVPIGVGERKIVTGEDPEKAIRVYRESGYPDLVAGRLSTLKFLNAMNGVFGQGNLTSAQRAAGRTTYRAIMLYGQANVEQLKLWMPPVGGSQAVFSLASESPVAGVIQTIANETTAPTGVTWVTPTTEAGALLIPLVGLGGSMGLWVRRVFPAAGTVAVRENFNLTIRYRGGQ